MQRPKLELEHVKSYADSWHPKGVYVPMDELSLRFALDFANEAIGLILASIEAESDSKKLVMP